MKKNGIFSTGITSLVMILVVLALSIFGILTYLSGRNDYLLTCRNGDSVQQYYEAVGKKEAMLQQLDVLLETSSMEQALEQLGFSWEPETGRATWSCPVRENCDYILTLKIDGKSWEVLSEYTENTQPWQEETIEIWSGEE